MSDPDEISDPDNLTLALLELDGAIIRYLAAKHANLVESFTEDSPAYLDLVLTCLDDLENAISMVFTHAEDEDG